MLYMLVFSKQATSFFQKLKARPWEWFSSHPERVPIHVEPWLAAFNSSAVLIKDHSR